MNKINHNLFHTLEIHLLCCTKSSHMKEELMRLRSHKNLNYKQLFYHFASKLKPLESG